MAKTPRATVTKDPFSLIIDIPGLKDGVYTFEGAATPESWAKVCETVGVPAKGEGRAKLSLDVAGPVIRVSGALDVVIEQVCVRTLEPFMSEQTLPVSETLLRPSRGDTKQPEEEDALMLEDEQFDLGDYLTQHIVLGLDPYPIKDPAARGLRGGILVSDGLEETIKEEKNPFSVLKQLKS